MEKLEKNAQATFGSEAPRPQGGACGALPVKGRLTDERPDRSRVDYRL